MGCGASKLDNEDRVRRCKERRRLIKSAVVARHYLAAAHSDYFRSLRLTGSSLSSFAHGQPLYVSPQTPSVYIHTKTTIPHSHSQSIPSNSFNNFPPKTNSIHSNSYTNNFPPKTNSIHSNSYTNDFPPKTNSMPFAHKTNIDDSCSLSSYSASQRGNSNLNGNRKQHQNIPLPRILSESGHSSPQRGETRKQKLKLPHILSESSPSGYSTPREAKKFDSRNNTYKAEDLNYSETMSQTSSVWNWENFYPPSPPPSEFFDKKNNHSKKEDHGEEDSVSVYSDFFERGGNKNGFRSESFKNQMYNHEKEFSDRASDKEYVGSESFTRNKDYNYKEEDREEVEYSEWDDHYKSTSSSSDELESSRSVPPPAENEYRNEHTKQDKYQNGGSSIGEHDTRMVVKHRDLVEIVDSIKNYFDKAASAGEQVGVMLEIGRAQVDRNFSKLKKTVYHSSGVFSKLSSSWTSKPPLAVKYQFEPSSMIEPGGSKSLCSTLEKLLAWEKKLYQEVKAREGVKIEHEKKLSSLQSHECRGDSEAKLDKTKAEINKLQSLILVTSQAVSTTSSAIIGVRDTELVPELVELCHGFMYMWRSMNQFHEIQNQIVQQVRGLVNQSMKGESTSDLHRQATRDLESAVSAWHSSFCRLVKFQRDFICSLHGWFKLTLLPLNTEPINGNVENSEAFSFFDEWKLALDRLPDTVASEAIKSFINVVHSISLKQSEELKIKKRTETASKELEKKAASLRSIEKKYYHSYSMVGIGLPDTGPDNGHVLDARDPLADKKFELEGCRRKVEDEMSRHLKAVEVTRAMTLNNIQTGLPGVFQAMTSFSALVIEALETVCTRSYAIK